MKDKSSNKKKKIIYILFPIFVLATIVELVLLLNPSNSNKELKQNSNNGIKSIKEPNYEEDITLGDILYNSTDVRYDNSNSGLSSTNVKDELYEKANSDSFWLKKYKTWAGTPTNYIFDGMNAPTTSSPTTPPSGKNVYLGLYADNQYGVCIKRNGTQHCFRYNNWIAESKHIQEVFSDGSCDVFSSTVNCYASDFRCSVYSNGNVDCNVRGTYVRCYVNGDGVVGCEL